MVRHVLLVTAFLFAFGITVSAQTASDADIDLMQRAQMVAEIKKLRAENSSLNQQIGEYKGKIELYEKLDAKQEARILDLKESIKYSTSAIGINSQIENLFKERIFDYQTENHRLRTENDKLRKSRDRWSLIFGSAGLIIGGLLH